MSQNKIQYLLELIQEDGKDPFPYFALAKEYEKIDDTDNARKNYEILTADFPGYGGTYYHYAQFLITKNDAEKAKEVIETGLNILKEQNENHLYNELSGLYLQLFE